MTVFTAIGAAALIAEAYKVFEDYRRFLDVLSSDDWRQRVRGAAASERIDPALLGAVVWVESKFDPEAVGTSGEYGLGQFKPIAAEDVGIEFDALQGNPDLQLVSAAKLLRLNARRLGGDMIGSVRAYNVGIGKVRKDKTAGWVYAGKVGAIWLADKINETLGANNWDA